MICSSCGFVCDCALIHSFACNNAHYIFHEQVMQEQAGFFASQASTSSSAGQSIFGPIRIKHCQSCEEEVGVTYHICKKIKASYDCFDLLILVRDLKLNELRKKHE